MPSYLDKKAQKDRRKPLGCQLSDFGSGRNAVCGFFCTFVLLKPKKKMKIKGKTVLITGACSGIGKIMARRCMEKGAKQVIIWDINENAIAATVEELF